VKTPAQKSLQLEDWSKKSSNARMSESQSRNYKQLFLTTTATVKLQLSSDGNEDKILLLISMEKEIEFKNFCMIKIQYNEEVIIKPQSKILR
jgi:hypothetical protein